MTLRGIFVPLVLGWVLLATACGWHLRGTLALPEGVDTIHINSESDSEVLLRTLEQLLDANEVQVADSAGEAQLTIHLLSYEEERRVVSIGDNTLVTEYELIAEADFSVDDARGETLLPPSEVSVIRSYQFDQNNMLGMADEERMIREEMRLETAQQIVRRLRFMNAQGEPESPAPRR